MSATESQQKVQSVTPGEHPVPPAGEEIHLPGGSAIPLVVAVGITLTVIGSTIWWVWSAVGFIIFAVAVTIWIRDVRREIDHLPEEHGH